MLISAPTGATKQEIMDRVRAMAPRFAERAATAEEARRLPQESVHYTPPPSSIFTWIGSARGLFANGGCSINCSGVSS